MPTPIPTPTLTPNVSIKILIVEDDAKIADMIGNYLRASGYDTLVEADGARALQVFSSYAPHLVLLDVMLPSLDGVAVCRHLRQHSGVPIIMVTARVDEIDRLLGLEMGADDYVCKPFSPRELLARIKALLRRSQGALAPVANPEAPKLELHNEAQRVTWAGHTVPLTPVEFRLFQLMFQRPGQVFGRAKLLDVMHDDYRDTSDRVIDSHIKNLRKKIQQVAPQDDCITSVYGIGYRFDVPEVAVQTSP